MATIRAAKPAALNCAGRYYLKDRQRALEQQRAYYGSHREEICAAHEEYRKTHWEYTRDYAREYYWRNRAKMLEYGRKYREAKKAHSAARPRCDHTLG